MNATNSGNVEKSDDLYPKYSPHNESLNVSVKFFSDMITKCENHRKMAIMIEEYMDDDFSNQRLSNNHPFVPGVFFGFAMEMPKCTKKQE